MRPASNLHNMSIKCLSSAWYVYASTLKMEKRDIHVNRFVWRRGKACSSALMLYVQVHSSTALALIQEYGPLVMQHYLVGCKYYGGLHTFQCSYDRSLLCTELVGIEPVVYVISRSKRVI